MSGKVSSCRGGWGGTLLCCAHRHVFGYAGEVAMRFANEVSVLPAFIDLAESNKALDWLADGNALEEGLLRWYPPR